MPNSNVFYRFVAGVLLLAAIGKIISLCYNPFTELEMGYTKSGVVCICLLEMILAFVIIFSKSKFTSWLCSFATFLVFFLNGIKSAIAGEATCNCFGVLNVPQFFTLSLCATTLTVLAWLGIQGIRKNKDKHTQEQFSSALFLVGIAAPMFYFLSVSELPSTGNSHLIASPSFAEGFVDEETIVELRMENKTNESGSKRGHPFLRGLVGDEILESVNTTC